jgi:DUF1009 family protein
MAVIHLMKAGGYSFANARDFVETQLNKTKSLEKKNPAEQ